jgi:hypothetical protein
MRVTGLWDLSAGDGQFRFILRQNQLCTKLEAEWHSERIEKCSYRQVRHFAVPANNGFRIPSWVPKFLVEGQGSSLQIC